MWFYDKAEAGFRQDTGELFLTSKVVLVELVLVVNRQQGAFLRALF
jgi:hypothetical protein